MNPADQQVDTRVKILTEAERLFRHYGYGKTTIADISDACNMSAANIYRFFPSKSALVEAICANVIAQLEQMLLPVLRAKEPVAVRLEQFIKILYNHTLENLLDHRKVHEMVVVAMEEQWVAVRAHVDRVRLLLKELIKDGIASGEFRAQDVERASHCAQAAMVCFCHPVVVAQKLDDENRARPEEVAAFIVQALR